MHLGVLRYGVPQGSKERFVPVRPGTVLERLQRLSERLALKTGWTEAQATIFVLTGLPPLIQSVRIHIATNEDMPALSRIVISVDPSFSPRELADIYRQVRQQFVSKRHRELTDKHIYLALFAARQPHDLPVSARMAAWNEEHPEWAYVRESNFSHDSLQAQRRLLGAAVREKKPRKMRGTK